MLMMVLWTLIALVTAALVLVVAGAAGADGADRPPVIRSYVGDVRAGLHSLRAGRAGRAQRGADTSMEDLFASAAEQAPAYFGVDDLTETLARARERATRVRLRR